MKKQDVVNSSDIPDPDVAKKFFDENGFYLFKGILDRSMLEDAAESLKKHAAIFAKRVGISTDDIDTLVQQLEEESPKLLWDFQLLMAKTQCLKFIQTSKQILDVFELFTNVPKEEALIHEGAFLINPDHSKRLQYTWHTAEWAYPKRQIFTNNWIPVIRPKTASNGGLDIAVGSHKYRFPVVEGVGYSKTGTHRLTQAVIPKTYVDRFEVIRVEAEPGDLAIMHPRCLHSSTYNTSSKPSYLWVFKVWNYRADWTVSPTINSRTYSEVGVDEVADINISEEDLALSMTAGSTSLV